MECVVVETRYVEWKHEFRSSQWSISVSPDPIAIDLCAMIGGYCSEAKIVLVMPLLSVLFEQLADQIRRGNRLAGKQL